MTDETSAVKIAKLGMERERDRYVVLMKRSEVLDARAGTMLSTLVVVGGVIGAFWAFALDPDSASTVSKLADDDLTLASLLVAIVLYGVAAVLMGASLLIGVQIWGGFTTASLGTVEKDQLDVARADYRMLANGMTYINNWKWGLLIAAFAVFAVAFGSIAMFGVRLFLLLD